MPRRTCVVLLSLAIMFGCAHFAAEDDTMIRIRDESEPGAPISVTGNYMLQTAADHREKMYASEAITAHQLPPSHSPRSPITSITYPR